MLPTTRKNNTISGTLFSTYDLPEVTVLPLCQWYIENQRKYGYILSQNAVEKN